MGQAPAMAQAGAAALAPQQLVGGREDHSQKGRPEDSAQGARMGTFRMQVDRSPMRSPNWPHTEHSAILHECVQMNTCRKMMWDSDVHSVSWHVRERAQERGRECECQDQREREGECKGGNSVDESREETLYA